jgi:hypothetical protein
LPRFIDRAHPALAEQRQDFKLGKVLGDFLCRWGGLLLASLEPGAGFPASLPMATFIRQFGQRPCGASAAISFPHRGQSRFVATAERGVADSPLRRLTHRTSATAPPTIATKTAITASINSSSGQPIRPNIDGAMFVLIPPVTEGKLAEGYRKSPVA